MDEWADLKELLGFRDGYSIIKGRRVEWVEVLAAIKHATPLPPALSAQAARIKELEEALQEAWVMSNSYARRLVSEGHDDVVWYATTPAALDGERKVGR